MAVYLLHFDSPYRHARHYLGSAKLVMRRFRQHCTGRGSPLVAAVVAAGIGVQLVRTWAGGRVEERAFKRAKNSPRLCPLCRSHAGLFGTEKVARKRGTYGPTVTPMVCSANCAC